MPNASPPPPVQPATLRPREMLTLLKMSKSAFYRDLALGLVPEGFRIGKSRRWMRSEIMAWLEAGAPPAAKWEQMQRDQKRR
jgi:predicted DNA-binding transcriptional regulator AlpA